MKSIHKQIKKLEIERLKVINTPSKVVVPLIKKAKIIPISHVPKREKKLVHFPVDFSRVSWPGFRAF